MPKINALREILLKTCTLPGLVNFIADYIEIAKFNCFGTKAAET